MKIFLIIVAIFLILCYVNSRHTVRKVEDEFNEDDVIVPRF